ncbi:hypothetical protein [Glycomyces terrestris]|uniref:hypothetical protein n=1 Tax=Glycomyces terrestris TaxID=2493553 RepID=UPI001652AE53|nr:hypothetical protein [Glycomyces terrestris]
MGDNVDYGEYEADTYTNMDTGDAMDTTRFQQNFTGNRGCGNGDCQNKENPGEQPWIELMSAIPQAGQTANIKPKPSGMSTPGGQQVSAIVQQLRGADGDNYAIGAVKDGWQTFNNEFSNFEARLQEAVEALSMEWTGDDFDAFSEQIDIVKRNIAEVTEKITGENGILPLLGNTQSSIYELQGGDSGEVPYPAPLIWVDDGGWFDSAEFHIRPAFWDGDCEKVGDVCANESGNKIMEMAGLETGYQDEVQSFVEDRTNYYYQYYNSEANGYQPGSFSQEQARQMAQADAEGQINQDVGDINENYQQRLNNVNDDIVGRRDYANGEVASFNPEKPATQQTNLGDGGQPPVGYDPPGGGGGGSMPKAPGGMDSMNPPEMPGTDKPPTPSFDPPPNPSDPNLPGGNDPGGLDDNPWSPTTPDPDDMPSGGLAGGGGGGLGGGGLGGGGIGGGPGGGMGGGAGGLGAGGGVPGGLGAGGVGGMMAGGGGMGRGGAGAGAGGRGAGGRGPGGMGRGGGMAGGMMGAGGGRPGGAMGEDGQETGTWLTEDDDVWGIGNENDDPYA